MSILTDDKLDEFTITSRREIVFYLRQLINEGTQVSVTFNEGKDSVLTVLLDVDEEKGTLIFDWGGSEEMNRKLLQSNRNHFIARPMGVRNQFIGGIVREVSYSKRRAFSVDLPEKYIRLQRREFFRLTLPITQRPVCTITVAEKQEVAFETVDLGLGGVGLEIPSLPFPCELGRVFPNTRIDIKSQGVLQVTIKVCFIGEVSRGSRQAIRLGCHFENLTPGQENELQKFITFVQREERARVGR